MKLKIGEKELNIRFGYEPTLKSRIMSRLAKLENAKITDSSGQMENLEDLLLLLPEFLLVGLQVEHKEYRYDYDTGEGKDKQLEKAFSLVEEYSESEDGDVTLLIQELEDEMLRNSFLKRIFQKEKKKALEKSEKPEKKEN